MNDVADRLKALRIKAFGEWGGIAEISRKLGVPASTYTNYERGRTRRVPADVVEKLVELTGVRRDWLLRGEGPMLDHAHADRRNLNHPMAPQEGPPAETLLDTGRRINCVVEEHADAAAGPDRILVSEREQPYREMRTIHLPGVTVQGNSMAPVILHGQHPIIDPKASASDGDIVLVRLTDGRVLCKRYYEDRRHGLAILDSDGQGHPPMNVAERDVAEIYKVVGVFF